MIPCAGNSFFMKDSEKLSEWIDRFRSGELGGQELLKFKALLETDPGLRRELQIDRDLDILISRQDLIEVSEKIRRIRWKQGGSGSGRLPLLIAASLLFLVSVGIVLMFVNYDPPGPARNLHASTDFTPMKEFELLVGSVTRGPSVRLLQPPAKMIEKRGDSLLFEWTPGGSGSPVSFEFLDNRGELVGTSVVMTGNRFWFRSSGFSPGLYYWKMISEEELVTMGRIILW